MNNEEIVSHDYEYKVPIKQPKKQESKSGPNTERIFNKREKSADISQQLQKMVKTANGPFVQNTARNTVRPVTAEDDFWHKRNVFSKSGVRNTTYMPDREQLQLNS